MTSGAKQPEIKEVLMRSGWSESDIHDAFSHIEHNERPMFAPVIKEEAPVQKKKGKPRLKFSSSRTGLAVLLLVFCLIIGAIFYYYFEEKDTQTASDVSLPAHITIR
jgi:hypothetical protein